MRVAERRRTETWGSRWTKVDGRAVDRLAAALERMDNQALLDRVRNATMEEYDVVHDAAAKLQKKADESPYHPWRTGPGQGSGGSGIGYILGREGDLGWNVVHGKTGRVLRAFPGPEGVKGANSCEWMAESFVQHRLATEALEWLVAYEIGGAARERAARRQEERDGIRRRASPSMGDRPRGATKHPPGRPRPWVGKPDAARRAPGAGGRVPADRPGRGAPRPGSPAPRRPGRTRGCSRGRPTGGNRRAAA